MANPFDTRRLSQMAAVKPPSSSPYAAAVSSVRGKVLGEPPLESAAQAQPSTVSGALTQPASRANQTLGAISGAVNADPFQFKAPDPFTYDKNTDPAYQAALASTRANIADEQINTNARLRANGQGKSSYSEQVAQQIGTKAMTNFGNEVLPALIDQAFDRYTKQADRDLTTQQLTYGASQDKIGNLGSLYGLQNQEDFNNPLAEAQTTGNYLPGEARQYIDAILGLKRQAEAPGITAEARAGLSQQADAYRSALQGLGVDPSMFGADVNANQASTNIGSVGARTLAGQAQDLAAGAQEFGQQIDMAQLTGTINGKPTTAEEQRQLANLWTVADQTGVIPDALADLYGIAHGTETQAAKQAAQQIAISQQNADTSAFSAQTSRLSANNSIANANSSNTRAGASQDWGQKMDVWQATGVAPAGIPGVNPGTPWGGQSSQPQPKAEDYYAALDKSIYLSPEMVSGPFGATTDTGKTIVNDPTGMENYIYSLNLPNEETYKLLNRYGLVQK